MKENDLSRLKYAYIIGYGRSGTMLLSTLLNKHRECLASPEVEFIIFFHNQFSGKKNLSERDYKLICDFFKLFSYRHPVFKFMIDPDHLYKELCKEKIQDYNTLTKYLHLKFNFFGKPLTELKIIIDKNPSYTLHVDRLLKFSPEAKFIYLVRDYRANILSRKQSVEYRSPDTAFNAYLWLFHNKKVCAFMEKFPDRILQVKYEELVEAPGNTLQKICNFLGVSADKEMLEFYKDKEESFLAGNMENIQKSKERYQKTFSDVAQPVFTKRADAWKNDLPENDVKTCEAICGCFGSRFAYETTRPVSFLKRMVIRIKTFPKYTWALYDYYKEFILYYFSPQIKMMRIEQKNRRLVVK